MVYLKDRTAKLGAKGPASCCEVTQEPTFFLSVFFGSLLCLHNNSKRECHEHTPVPSIVPTALSELSNWIFPSAVLFPEDTLFPAGDILLRKKSTETGPQGGKLHHPRNNTRVFKWQGRKENSGIRSAELNEQLLRASPCQVAPIFLEGSHS